MKLLILGASNSQVNLILKAKQKGHTVIVSDYYSDSPGKQYSDYNELVSTFDVEGNIEVARKHNIDGIMTIGTDQPVYTVARVAEEFNLPALISSEIAQAVTNKKIMKKILIENIIPTVNCKLLKEDFLDRELTNIKFPVVIKPLDSQGQRGVYKLDTIEEVRNYLSDSLSYSKEEEILVEEYYESDEITVSGWVDNGEVYLITVTDRISLKNFPHIGVCIAHSFPSKYLISHYDEIQKITKKIVQGFEIKNGPIYFQMLVGKEGIKVNEIACRLGGAYEDELILELTGIDVLDMLIDTLLGKNVDFTSLKNHCLLNITRKASVQLVFAKPGMIKKLGDTQEVKNLPGVIQAKYNFKEGQEVKEIVNATQRVGYMIILADNEQSLEERVNKAFEKFTLYDKYGNNLIINFNKP